MSIDDAAPPGQGHQWPDLSLWPDDNAPPRVWAQFYRDHLREIVVPTPGPRDVLAHANNIANTAAAEWALDNSAERSVDGEVPDDVAAAIWDAAREEAERNVGRPIGYIYTAWMKKVAVASDVTDAMLDEAWSPLEHSRGPRASADERGIAIVPRRHCLVDVDVGHGDGQADGDVDGPWGWGLPGPKASTPRGGLHTLVLSTGKETAACDLGPGVDVVAAGGGTAIPLPAGSATPDRRWLRKDPPVEAPAELRKRGRRKAPPRPSALAHGTVRGGEANPGREPGEDWDDAPGHTADLIAASCGDGERNRVAPAIVGMLARPRACPPDFVAACLEMLAEEMAGRMVSRAEAETEVTRWRSALTRGPRDVDFAAEVLEVWYRVRVTATNRWKTTPRKLAASVWKVCDRREEGRAGAEDFGEGPDLGWWPARRGPPPAPREAAGTPADEPRAAQASVPDDAPPYPPPSPERAQEAVEASKGSAPASTVRAEWRGGIDPRTYTRTLDRQYSNDDILADCLRSPIRIDKVFPACDFVTGLPLSGAVDDPRPGLHHGWGPHLGRDLGGLAPRDFKVIGASGAGAGKTWFEVWLAHGLALATAARILGVPGYEKAPLVCPVWLTEMPKPGELFLRGVACHLGVPMDVVTEGVDAASSPRVIAYAERLRGGWTPDEIVRRGREAIAVYGSDERFPFAFARKHVIHTLAVTDLPRVTRHRGVAYDHRGGVGIIDHMADAIDVARDDLARLAGVPASEVLPLALVDPGQRFISAMETSEKRGIDTLFEAIRQTLCLEVGAAVIATSDTTKAAAREASSIDVFLSKPTGALAADIFAGSQAIQHQADCIALQAEPVKPGCHTTRMWVRTFKSRAGGATDIAYPFTWEMGLGRFVPDIPEPLRAPPERDDARPQRRDHAPPPGTHRAVYPGRKDFGLPD